MSHTYAKKDVSHTYEKKTLRHFGVEGFEFGVLDFGAGWNSGCSLDCNSLGTVRWLLPTNGHIPLVLAVLQDPSGRVRFHGGVLRV